VERNNVTAAFPLKEGKSRPLFTYELCDELCDVNEVYVTCCIVYDVNINNTTVDQYRYQERIKINTHGVKLNTSVFAIPEGIRDC